MSQFEQPCSGGQPQSGPQAQVSPQQQVPSLTLVFASQPQQALEVISVLISSFMPC
jgi:hypothetical protein